MKSFLQSFSPLSLQHSRKVVVSYKRMYVHEVLLNRLSQEKNVVSETDPPAMTIAVDWDVKQQNKHTQTNGHSKQNLRTNSPEYTPANTEG